MYTALKSLVDDDRTSNPIEHLQKLVRFSEYYAVLHTPETAPSPQIGERLKRLNRLEVTVAYPFLLSVYADYVAGTIPDTVVVLILDTLENYLVRRFVCGVPTYGLNKIFAPLYDQALRADTDLVVGVQKVLGQARVGTHGTTTSVNLNPLGSMVVANVVIRPS